MQLFAGDSGASSANMKMLLTFRLDGLEIQTDNRMVIQDALLTRIKSIATKMHYAYLQADFAIRNYGNRIKPATKPTDSSGTGDDGEDVFDDGEAFVAFMDNADGDQD